MVANLSIVNILPNRVTDIYIKLKSITSKLSDDGLSGQKAFCKVEIVFI